MEVRISTLTLAVAVLVLIALNVRLPGMIGRAAAGSEHISTTCRVSDKPASYRDATFIHYFHLIFPSSRSL